LLADDSTVEACKHKTLPWYGIMWHPERKNDVSKALDLALINATFKQIIR
jgi:putative glutamine amidotransferase